MLVVSATPQEALQREWEEHDLTKYVVAICGQEIGTKKECLQAARQLSALPHADDRRRARRPQGGVANGALLLPRQSRRGGSKLEAAAGRGLDRFFAGTFAGKYQEELLAEFDRYLPEHPPWKR